MLQPNRLPQSNTRCNVHSHWQLPRPLWIQTKLDPDNTWSAERRQDQIRKWKIKKNEDVTILEPFTVLDVPALAFQLFNKTIDQNSRIKTFRCKKLCIHRSSPGVVHFDGDPMQADEDIKIELIQKGLRVVVPGDKKKDNPNVLQKAQEYVNGIKLINEAIVEDIAHKNKVILKKNS